MSRATRVAVFGADALREAVATCGFEPADDGVVAVVDAADAAAMARASALAATIPRVIVAPSELHASLRRHGLTAGDITDVVLTHLHFDHAGGSTFRDDGGLRPSFPKARYYVQKSHWDLALHPTARARPARVHGRCDRQWRRGMVASDRGVLLVRHRGSR